MRRLFLGCVLVCTGIWGWLACTSFDSAPVGDGSADGSSDGGGGGNDGGGNDGADDAPSPPSEAEGGSFCDDAGAGWQRCFDFDRKKQLASPFGFDGVAGQGGTTISDDGPEGRLTIDSTDKTSAPNSLRVETIDGGSASLDVLLPSTPNLIRVHARFQIVEIVEGNSTSSHFLTLQCQKSKPMRTFVKISHDGELGLRQEEVDGGGLDPSSVPLPGLAKAWHTLEVQWANASTSNATILIQVDGAPMFDPSPLPVTPLSCPSLLRFGSNVSQVGTYVFRFDDILVDWK